MRYMSYVTNLNPNGCSDEAYRALNREHLEMRNGKIAKKVMVYKYGGFRNEYRFIPYYELEYLIGQYASEFKSCCIY